MIACAPEIFMAISHRYWLLIGAAAALACDTPTQPGLQGRVVVGQWGGETQLIATTRGAELHWSDSSQAPSTIECRDAYLPAIVLNPWGEFEIEGRLSLATVYSSPFPEALSGSAPARFVGTVIDGKMQLTIIRTDDYPQTFGPEE